MNDQVQAAPETVVTAEEAKPTIRNINEVKAFVEKAISGQNEIEIVSSEITQPQGKGKRLELTLKGAGVDHPTRRYFLRENSASARAIREAGILMHAPKKGRNSDTYTLMYGLNEAAVMYEAPAAPKAPKVLLSDEEKKQRRLDGKKAAKARRAEEEAAKAIAAAADGQTEGDDSVDQSGTEVNSPEAVVLEVGSTTVTIESDEPVVLAADDSESSEEVNTPETEAEPA